MPCENPDHPVSPKPNDRRAPKVVALISSLGIGGAERLVVDWAIASNASGKVRPAVIVVNDDYHASLVAELRASGIELFLLGRKRGSRNVGPLISLIFTLHRLRPDILHAHDYAAERIALLIKCLFPRIALFATIHNPKDVVDYHKLYIRLCKLPRHSRYCYIRIRSGRLSPSRNREFSNRLQRRGCFQISSNFSVSSY